MVEANTGQRPQTWPKTSSSCAVIGGAKPPMFLRPLTSDERRQLAQGLRSRPALTVRRCQILLASSRGERVSHSAPMLGCATQTVRHGMRDAHRRGLASLTAGPRRPKAVRPVIDAREGEALRALSHTSPRLYGKPTGLWTLELVAEVPCAQGLTKERLSRETLRQAMARLGVQWKRAKERTPSCSRLPTSGCGSHVTVCRIPRNRLGLAACSASNTGWT
jgi:transposase